MSHHPTSLPLPLPDFAEFLDRLNMLEVQAQELETRVRQLEDALARKADADDTCGCGG